MSYDYAVCDYPLPDAEYQREVFQTHAMYGQLDHYRITQDGRFVLECEPGARDWLAQPEDMAEHLENDEIDLLGGGHTGWIAYVVRFESGRVASIRRVPEEHATPWPPNQMKR